MRKLAAILALALTLALPVSVFAAEGTSQNVPETFTVNATYTLTGVPSSLTYPDQPALAPGIAWAPVINIIAFGSSNPGAILSMSATDLTSSTHTIPATDRKVYTTNEVNCQTKPVNGNPSGSGSFNLNGAGVSKTLATLGATQNTGSLDLGLGINMAGNVQAGVYTGSVTIAVGN